MSTLTALLEGYENAEPLPTDVKPSGRYLVNPPGLKSTFYDSFPKPFLPNTNGFDFHIYHTPTEENELKHAQALHERIRREFPEFDISRFFTKPGGPHPLPMFSVNTNSPHETGALFTFLAVNRGPCSVLVHPNTGDEVNDHTILATWMGRILPIKLEALA